jgi:hypothetical protein
MLNKIQLNNKKIRYGLIVLGIIIFFAILFVIFQSGQKIHNQKQQTPKWQTSKQLIATGKIPPPSKILEVDLEYNEGNNPKLTISGLAEKNGYVPSILINPNPYGIQLLDINNRIVYQQQFNLSNKANYDYPDSEGNLHGGIVSLSNFSFAETLPWFDSINQIRILDENAQIITSEPFLNVKVINNNSDFRSIRGDELLNNQDKLNINTFQPQKALAATGRVLNIVFIGNGYTDMNAFHADATRFGDTFLTFEPYKSYASKIMFHTIDNTRNLGCGASSGLSRLVVCNSQLVIQIVNSSGVPHDGIAVINNSSQYGGGVVGGIPAQYNGPKGPAMFVHEFGGHIFGRLLDEYLYTGEASNGPINNKLYNIDGVATVAGDGNCYAGNPPASGWNGLVNSADYKQGCNNELNWYAPSQSSVMRALGNMYFNAVSQAMIKRRLDALLGSDIVIPTKTPTAALTLPAGISPKVTPPSSTISIIPTFNCFSNNPCVPTPKPTSTSMPNQSPALSAPVTSSQPTSIQPSIHSVIAPIGNMPGNPHDVDIIKFIFFIILFIFKLLGIG